MLTGDGPLHELLTVQLFLHVVGRRADGYHLLQTAFRFVDHGDSLSFAPRDDGEIVLDHTLDEATFFKGLRFIDEISRILAARVG